LGRAGSPRHVARPFVVSGMTRVSSRPQTEPTTALGAEGIAMRDSAEVRSRFADRVQALLGEMGLSKDELAERSALPASRVDRILAGSLVPVTFRDMTVIAAVLGTPVHALLLPTNAAVEVVSLEVVEERRPGDA
jgi:ribosome-binding protein aMBF1 (putative translation factor)